MIVHDISIGGVARLAMGPVHVAAGPIFDRAIGHEHEDRRDQQEQHRAPDDEDLVDFARHRRGGRRPKLRRIMRKEMLHHGGASRLLPRVSAIARSIGIRAVLWSALVQP